MFGKRRNRILDRISSRDLGAISADLHAVGLHKDAVLFEPDEPVEYVYFPAGAVISFRGKTGRAESVEVWAVGKEGAAGVSGIVGRTEAFEAVVQVPGMAWRAKASRFRRHFQKRGSLHDALLRYMHYLVCQVSYLGICNSRHPIDQRFSRWLLMLQDRAGSNELQFTQSMVACTLGTRRATISVAAAALQAAGLISYKPGAITIKSRKALERASCSCYRSIADGLP